MSKESVFDKLFKINVSDKTDKKGKFTYLSWTYAWAELKKIAPDSKVTVYHDENTNMPYFASSAGVIVKVGVTVNDLEHISYLPCMDFRNNAMDHEAVSMMDVNKAIQRATVKAIGLHGLGLYIYAGEDLPEEESDKEPKKTSSRSKPKAETAPKKEVKKEEPVAEESTEETNEEPRKGFRRRRA